MPEETPQNGLTDNIASLLAYFTFIPAIIFLVVAPYNQKPEIRFHAWQSIFLSIAAFVINLALSIVLGVALIFLPFALQAPLWGLIDLAWLAIWLVTIFNAYNGKHFKLPVIGELAEKQAGSKPVAV
jgi:uncharacterized membrane protein